MARIKIAVEGEKCSVVMAKDLSAGQLFTRLRNSDIFMKVRPASFLLNSTLVQTKLSEGATLVVNISQGTCHFISGEDVVNSQFDGVLSLSKSV